MSGSVDDPLKMSFDPKVIDDLGAKLYSTLPPIIAELIANGYDACAKEVKIELHDGDNQSEKYIVITDNGHGMSYDEINSRYLVVGRKKREAEAGERKCKREPIGKKGLGKLSFFGIARTASIETVQDGKKVSFVMDLDEIHGATSGSYQPAFEIEDTSDKNGTRITLTKIYRKTDFEKDALIRSISNYFIFDDDFRVFIKMSTESDFTEIENSVRYEHPDRKAEYTWKFPETALRKEVKQFSFSGDIKGEVMLFDKPVRSSLRGVTLFSRRKLVNLPEFFPVQGSGFFFQYLTGWLEVDFIDDMVPDVISTNRSSLTWTDDNLSELKEFLDEIIRYIQSEWRRLIKDDRKKNIKDKFNVDTDDWRESNRNNKTITDNIDKLLPIIDEPEEMSNQELQKVFEIVHNLAPNHADFVLWNGLHKKITENDVIREKFFAGSYIEAAREAAQIYNEEVQRVSGRSEDGYDLMNIAFGPENGTIISLTNRANDSDKNLENGQKLLSQGIMTGFKNPGVSHSSITAARASGVFTDRNCLDILSTISYLFDRLERRVNPAP
ncbi:MAG TPA: TIGR02391 family protein [Candidatus Saccharibacteria bacterium]|nr:TIGR02391 family protein [Candidatus Saccharibacteria bacterium]